MSTFVNPPESGYFEGRRYDVARLYEFAETIPTEEIPLDAFREVISPQNESWLGTDGKIIGPFNIYKDWTAAQANPIWHRHVESIRNVSLDVPILATYTGYVLDGQHRVVRSFIEKRSVIKIKRLPRVLPEWAVLPSKQTA